MRRSVLVRVFATFATLYTLAPSALADAPALAKPEIVPVKSEAVPAPAPTPSDTPKIDVSPDIPFVAKSPDYKVSLALEDADLSELVRTVGQLTGRRFILASAHAKGLKATIFAPEKVSVAEAYQAFLAVLQANGLTVLPSGAFWRIVDSTDAAKQSTPFDSLTGEARYVTRILRMHHVGAEDVATNVLGKFTTHDGSVVPYAPGNLLILTDTGENIARMEHILAEVDVAVAGDKVWFEPMHYVSASEVEKKLSDVLGVAVKSDTKTPAASINASDHLTRLIALDRPNAIVVVGTEPAYRRVLSLLARIDVPVASEGAIHVVALQYADAKKIVPAINEAIQGAGAAAKGASGEPISVLDAQVKVSAEETTNTILVTSTEHDFAAVREVIGKLDKPRRQVYIEAVIMNLSLEKDSGVGVMWHGIDVNSSSGTALYGGMNAFNSLSAPGAQVASAATDSQLQALALGVRGPSVSLLGQTIPAFGAFIEASAHSLDSDILQTPHILATDNIPAEIHVQLNRSLQQNYPSYSSLSSGSSGATAAASLNPYALGTAPASSNYGKIGPQIKVTPHLNESDDVRLDIEETISDTDGIPQGTLGTISYTERGTKTTLTVRDQQTVVIGGLVADKITHEVVKTPLLGDIPILGALFRHTSEEHDKGDLVLILTPYVIRDSEDMRRIAERRMQERQDFLAHEALFDDRPWEAPKTYARAHGLVAAMRKEARTIDNELQLAAQLAARPPLTHEPSAPIELPSTASATPTPTPAPAPSGIPAASPFRIEH